jgi:hypothetical protein
MAVVITYKTKATACRALTFIGRVFVNDSIAAQSGQVLTRFAIPSSKRNVPKKEAPVAE